MMIKSIIFILSLVVFTNLNAQSVIKSSFSSFTPTLVNDSLIISVGQSLNGYSSNNNLILHGYLPLTRHFLDTPNTLQPDLIIYPNPTNNFIFITSPFINNGFIKIYSSTGILVYTSSFNVITSIDVQFLSSGLYFVELTDSRTFISSTKFVKN